MAQPPETLQQRRNRYLSLAEKSEAFARRSTTPAVRDAYLKLAKSWKEMAADIPEENA
jgi:hypothetical protein